MYYNVMNLLFMDSSLYQFMYVTYKIVCNNMVCQQEQMKD